jgi:C1A family cysteine protease
MNKTILIIASTALLVAAGLFNAESANLNDIPAPVHAAFAKWANDHGKNYATPSERTFRLANFYKTYLRVTAENMTAVGYKMGLNQFSDLTKNEFLTKFTGFNFQKTQRNNAVQVENLTQPPANVDWVQAGAVVGVKNQGQCGSCWAFSAVAALEAANKIKNGSLVSMSEQQLVDCSGSYGNQGCNGGWMDYAFAYVKDNGITSEAAYGYTGVQGSCAAAGKPIVTKATGYTDVPANSG